MILCKTSNNLTKGGGGATKTCLRKVNFGCSIFVYEKLIHIRNGRMALFVFHQKRKKKEDEEGKGKGKEKQKEKKKKNYNLLLNFTTISSLGKEICSLNKSKNGHNKNKITNSIYKK